MINQINLLEEERRMAFITKWHAKMLNLLGGKINSEPTESEADKLNRLSSKYCLTPPLKLSPAALRAIAPELVYRAEVEVPHDHNL